jgi:short-subunit dehydrogenase
MRQPAKDIAVCVGFLDDLAWKKSWERRARFDRQGRTRRSSMRPVERKLCRDAERLDACAVAPGNDPGLGPERRSKSDQVQYQKQAAIPAIPQPFQGDRVMFQTVAGKKVLITGAAMGMGKIYAQQAVREDAAAVILWDINQAEMDKTVAELKAAGGKVFPYLVDVSRLEAIVDAAARVKAEVGDPDILLNNAGVVRGKWFWEHDHLKDTWFTMSINALAPMYIAREFLPAMIANKSGESRVVNIASAAGLVSNPRMSVYCASKWSCTGWSDSVRLELEECGHSHVRVTTVNPSYISTGMFEGAKSMLLAPILTPEYVTSRVWAAMKAGAPRLILPWTVHFSNVLRALLPIRLWDFVARNIIGICKSMSEFKGRDGK